MFQGVQKQTSQFWYQFRIYVSGYRWLGKTRGVVVPGEGVII